MAWQRRRGEVEEAVEERLDAEVGQRAAEEHRRQVAGAEGGEVEGRAGAVQQRDLVEQLLMGVGADRLAERRVVEVADLHHRPVAGRLAAFEAQQAVGVAIVDALELRPGADRPVERGARHVEHALDLVEQIERLAPVAVELVDEGDDRQLAGAADLEQLDRLRLDALGAVDEHHRAVGRGQGAVGVLAEVVVAGGVEQVELEVAIGELHHAGRDRDAALAFERHPVAGRVALGAPLLDRAGEADRAAVEQQLLGQRRLAGVRVGDDGEGTPPAGFGTDFLGEAGHSPLECRAGGFDARWVRPSRGGGDRFQPRPQTAQRRAARGRRQRMDDLRLNAVASYCRPGRGRLMMRRGLGLLVLVAAVGGLWRRWRSAASDADRRTIRRRPPRRVRRRHRHRRRRPRPGRRADPRLPVPSDATRTSTLSDTPTPTSTPAPTATPVPPQILLFGVARADDLVQAPDARRRRWAGRSTSAPRGRG